MSDRELANQVLGVLRLSHEPMRAKDLYVKLNDLQISKPQGRRGLFTLTTMHAVEITPDMTVKLMPHAIGANL